MWILYSDDFSNFETVIKGLNKLVKFAPRTLRILYYLILYSNIFYLHTRLF